MGLVCKRNELACVAVAATLAIAVISPRMGWAQAAEAALRGKAAANSEITVRNKATGLTRRTQSGADGSYSIVGLPPGTYSVNGADGAEATVTLTVASTSTVDLQQREATAEVATVTVRSVRPTEVKTSEIATTISEVQIQTIPQLTRNFLEFADTVPGMVFTVDAQGHTSLTGGAQNANAVNVYIDGVGQKNYVKEGGVAGQFSSQGNPFPQLAIGEYKVITSNYKAEYDQISSAAVTADTKSGTNEFHGEAFGTYTGQSFRAETPSEADAGVKTPSTDKEFGASLGGPIIQDVLHFFLTYEGKRFNTPIAVTPGTTVATVAGIKSLLPPDVAAQLGPGELPFSEDLYFGKFDWEPTDKDRVVLSTKVRRETQADNIGAGQAASSSILVENDDTRLDLRWQHTEDKIFNEVLFTYEDTKNAPTARSLGNGSQYTYQPQQDALIVDVGPSSPLATQNKSQRGPAFQDDVTLTGLHWLGDHTIKTGFKVKRVVLTAQDAEDINPQFYYDVNPAPAGTAAVPYKAFFTDPVPGQNPVARSNNTQFGLYIQDDWAPTERLTFNLGVRWDYELTPSYLDHVTPASLVQAFNTQDPNAPAGQTYAQSLALGGVNINDYISNGHNRTAPTADIAPRFGVSFDLNGDQKHVLFAGAGRSYDRDLFDYLQVEETKAALPQYTLNFNVPERPCIASPTCIPFNPNYLNGLQNLQALVNASTVGQEADMINNNLRVPYSDQFSFGMRNKIGDWNTSATIARIISKDGFVFTLGNRLPNGQFWSGGNAPFDFNIPNYGSLIIGNNGIETRTTQVLLSIEKPYTEESGWGTTFAYTFTDAITNRSVTEHYSFDEETIQQYPFIPSNGAARHRFVASGTVRGPFQTTLALKVTLATPIPEDNIACFLPDGQVFPNGNSCVPEGVRPPDFLGYRETDLQVSKDINFGKYASAYVRLDFLNVFNNANFADYVDNFGTTGQPPAHPVTYNQTGNIDGVPRTLKLTGGVRF
jgi:outer membrane receptor protein involved in Fe transport